MLGKERTDFVKVSIYKIKDLNSPSSISPWNLVWCMRNCRNNNTPVYLGSKQVGRVVDYRWSWDKLEFNAIIQFESKVLFNYDEFAYFTEWKVTECGQRNYFMPVKVTLSLKRNSSVVLQKGNS